MSYVYSAFESISIYLYETYREFNVPLDRTSYAVLLEEFKTLDLI